MNLGRGKRECSDGRIAFVYDHLYPHSLGGAERYYWALARRWAQGRPTTYVTVRHRPERRREHEGVEIIAVTGALRSSSPGRARLVRDRMLPKLGFAAGLLWHFLRRGRRYEVVHCCCFPHLAVVAVGLGMLPHRGGVVIVDWHEVLPRATWRRRLGAVGELGYAAQAAALQMGDGAITFSHLHRRRLLEEGFSRPIEVVPEFPPEEVPKLLPGAGEGPRQPRIVFAGRLVAEKRPELVVAVLAELHRRDRSWQAVIFGVGPHEKQVRAEVARLGLDGAVRMAGFAPWSELSAALCSSRALVFPSVREGYGLIVLEAAAHALPSVLVSEPDNAACELVEQGRNGWVCGSADPAVLADAVMRLSSDPEVHQRTARWYERASRIHSLENAITELEAFEREVQWRVRSRSSRAPRGRSAG